MNKLSPEAWSKVLLNFSFPLEPRQVTPSLRECTHSIVMYQLLLAFFLSFVTQNTAAFESTPISNFIDVSVYNFSYYDPNTKAGLVAELEDSGRDPLSSGKIAFRGLPCQCESLSCSCCTGLNFTSINFDRRACTNFTYNPQDFAIEMTLSMNERVVYTNALSAKNPPPLCVPFAYFPLINFCVRFFDIYTPGRNFHTCIDFETRIVGSPILILHFNCIKIGADGISWSRPEDDTRPEANSLHSISTMPEISEPEIYDDVDFEIPAAELLINHTSTLSPEDELLIGQLKL